MEGKVYVYSYVGACCCVASLVITSLALNQWFEYCWWSFGLVHASTLTEIRDFEGETTISDVYLDACGSLKGLVEEYCAGFCRVVGDFESAGFAMLVFGCVSFCALFVSSVLQICSSMEQLTVMRVFLCLPSFFYSLGLVVYIGFLGS